MRDRAKTTARVYLRGAPTIHLSGDDAFDTASLAVDNGHIIRAVNTDGERVAIPHQRVIDIVEPNPEAAVTVQDGIFFGRRVEVCTLQAARQRYPSDFEGETWNYPDDSICVIAEDMAAAVGLLLSHDAKDVLWDNPANEDGVSKRYHRAALALAEAETLMVQAYADPESGTVVPIPDVPVVSLAEATEDAQKTAMATVALENGDVPQAIELAGAEYVAAFLTGGPSDLVEVWLTGGQIGTVVPGLDTDAPADEVPVRFGPEGYAVTSVAVSTIVGVRMKDNHDVA